MSEDRELDKRVLRGNPPSVGYAYPIPRYSRDIAAAWMVVEKFSLCVEPWGGGWCATRSQSGDPDCRDWFASDATAPRAICLAALKAVETK